VRLARSPRRVSHAIPTGPTRSPSHHGVQQPKDGRLRDVPPRVRHVAEQHRQHDGADQHVTSVEDAVVHHSADGRQGKQAQNVEEPEGSQGQLDIEILDPLRQEVRPDEEPEVEDGMCGEEEVDDPPEQAVVGVQAFVGETCDERHGVVGVLEGEEVV